MVGIGRREFIAALGGAAAWPLAARAQPGDRLRRIGVLMPGDESDPLAKALLYAFEQALADLGWSDSRVRIELRSYGDDNNRSRALAQELVGLKPDIILTSGTPATVPVQRETRTIPIVFANVGDPVATGIVGRLDRPSGNLTGFTNSGQGNTGFLNSGFSNLGLGKASLDPWGVGQLVGRDEVGFKVT